MDLKGKKVLIIGCGKSGMGAAALLSRVGAQPVLYDENAEASPQEIRSRLAEGVTAEIICGSLPPEAEEAADVLVPSPGVPVDTPLIERFRKRGVPIVGEVELASLFDRGRVIAITGTNGKTTTTALTGQILQDHFARVFVVGNIGNPYTLAALETSPDSVTVAEISSFQLETTVQFHPRVSAVLNVTPDHLNRHHTMENYAAVKFSIARNQTREDVCVLNYEDSYTRSFGEQCPARVVYFSSARVLEDGYYLWEESIYRAVNGRKERLLGMEETHLLGVHNAENIMAAIAMAEASGVPMAEILESVRRFEAVEHRIEFVAKKKGVVYYNDSKGTNPDAAIRGIQAMHWPTILIGGGYDKQNTYDEWIEACRDKVKLFVLIGQTREKIADCIRAHGMENYVFADSFQEAMEVCSSRAQAGEAVLLSPACASWGMFPNYEVRGKQFKEYVYQLEE